jgi:CRP-like cAMP-binding protein
MDKEPLIAFLLNSNLVTKEAALKIAEPFQYKVIDKVHFQLKEGKICDEYLFLQRGFMRSYAIDIDGNEVTTNFYRDNNVVFEVSSFFKRTPSKENIHCLTECEGWVISYNQLNTLFHTLPEFREFGRSILVNNLTALKSRMLSMITETAEERYEHLLERNPEIFQFAPLKYIASYLGVTDTSLSRIRKEFLKK